MTLGEEPRADLMDANLSSASLFFSDSLSLSVIDSILRRLSGFVERIKLSLKSARNGNFALMARKSPSERSEDGGKAGSGQPCLWWDCSSRIRTSANWELVSSSVGSKADGNPAIYMMVSIAKNTNGKNFGN